MKHLLYLIIITLPFALFAENKGTTENFPVIEVSPVKNYNYKQMPKENTKNKHRTPGILSLDYNKPWRIIPPESAVVFKADPSSLEVSEIDLPYELTANAKAAVSNSPKWLRPALVDNFRRMSSFYQNRFAGVINQSPVQKRDENAFCIAHLAPETLLGLNPEILNVNSEYIYIADEHLQYVELTEYGSEAAEDWYTTAKYTVLIEGEEQYVEIPREIYYWWIVMPKLSDESPSMGSDVYNEFWRKYVWENADEGYPKLKDVLADVKYMWDCEEHTWRNEDKEENKYGFGDSLYAVQTVGRWTAATIEKKNNDDVRPVQPNQILHHHNGNCGENQDLLNAGCRTALLPVSSVGSHPGDHVWNELWWDDHWWYYQIDWDCGPTRLLYSRTYKEKGLITGWRGDMYLWQVNDHYNPVCTLNVDVADSSGNPVDGAEIVFFSALYKDPQGSQLYLGSHCYSDSGGRLTVELGTNINYGFRIDSEKGSYPVNNNQIVPFSYYFAKEGTNLFSEFTIQKPMPAEPECEKEEYTGEGSYKVEIDYNVPYRILYGGGSWSANYSLDDYKWHDFREAAAADFYIIDGENYEKYKNGEAFKAYEMNKKSDEGNIEFILPEEKDFFIVFSNKSKIKTGQLLQAGIKLYENDGGVWTLKDSLGMESILSAGETFAGENDIFEVYPNPSGGEISIYFKKDITLNSEIRIFDLEGNLIRSFDSINRQDILTWDGRDLSSRRVPAGVYVVSVLNDNRFISKKVVIK